MKRFLLCFEHSHAEVLSYPRQGKNFFTFILPEELRKIHFQNVVDIVENSVDGQTAR
jgi:hypothetical protein